MSRRKLDSLKVLSQDDARKITIDSRVAGLRWDIVPWGFVLDLDVPSSEADDSPMYRAWLVFLGIAEVLWPFSNARLPNGCWLTSEISVEKSEDGHVSFKMFGLLPRFDKNEQIIGSPTDEISLVARNMIGIISVDCAERTDRVLGWKDRNSIAPDDLLGQKLHEILQQLGSDSGNNWGQTRFD